MASSSSSSSSVSSRNQLSSGECHICGEQSTTGCIRCKNRYCSYCWTNVHRKSCKCGNQRQLSKDTVHSVCIHHESMITEFLCMEKTCPDYKKPLCCLCKELPEHKYHPIISLEQATRYKKDELELMTVLAGAELKSAQDNIKVFVKLEKETLERAAKKRERSEMMIDAHIDRKIARLQARRKEDHKLVKNNYEAVLEDLAEKKLEFYRLVAQVELAIMQTPKLITEENPHQIVASSAVFMDDLRKATELRNSYGRLCATTADVSLCQFSSFQWRCKGSLTSEEKLTSPSWKIGTATFRLVAYLNGPTKALSKDRVGVYLELVDQSQLTPSWGCTLDTTISIIHPLNPEKTITKWFDFVFNKTSPMMGVSAFATHEQITNPESPHYVGGFLIFEFKVLSSRFYDTIST